MLGKKIIRPLLRPLRKSLRKRLKLQAKDQRNAFKSNRQEHADRLAHIFSDGRWRDLFADKKFLLIDVGALGGFGKEWRGVTPLMRVIGFEPLNSPCNDGAMAVLNVGLDSAAGTRELHLAGPMSSFLQPDLDVWDQFGFRANALLERRLVKTTTLAD
jgi:hypothetical protein